MALLTIRELTLAVLLTTRDDMAQLAVIWSLWLGGGLGAGKTGLRAEH